MAGNEQKSSRVSHNDLSRKRAEHALKSVEDFGSASKTKGKDKDAYVSYVKSLPAVIRMNGLGQALAMLASRAKADEEEDQGGQSPDAYGAIYQHIQGWFADDTCPLRGVVTKSGDAPFWLLKETINTSQPDYLLVQTEAGLYVEWLKKFAIAFLTNPEEAAHNG